MALTNVAWVGRLTGPKGDIARTLISEVAPLFPEMRFSIVGGPVTDEYRALADGNVVLTDFVKDVNDIFKQNDLVIGAGRVPVEAMRFGRPVIAVGENRYIGPVTEKTIELAKATNFGDCDQLTPWDASLLINDLRSIAAGELEFPLDCYSDFVDDYRLDHVYPQVMAVYRQAHIAAALQRYKEIPVLTYHRVLREPPQQSKFNIYVTVDELETQLIRLKKRNFDFVTFKDIVNGAKPKKPVILTFDDGYEDNYQSLLPLLKKYQAKAVIYALGDRTVQNNYWDMALGEPEARLMNDEQLLECHQSGLVEIGSHGLSHQHLPQLSNDKAQQEIADSKQHLQELLQDEVVSFAYPYGDYGQREMELVREAGYCFGVATVSGPIKMANDLMRVRRITMFSNTKSAKFWRKTSGWYLRYCKLKGKDF